MLYIHPGGLPCKALGRLADAVPDVSLYVAEISASLACLGTAAPGIDGRDGIERIARAVLDDFAAVASEAIAVVCGWSLGGVVAHRVAQDVSALGRGRPMVVLLDAIAPVGGRSSDRMAPFSVNALTAGVRKTSVLMRWFIAYANALRGSRVSLPGRRIARSSEEEILQHLLQRLAALGAISSNVGTDGLHDLYRRFRHGMLRNVSLLAAHTPRSDQVDVVLFRASKPLCWIFHLFRSMGWRRIARSVTVRTVKGDHYQLVADPECIHAIAAELRLIRDRRRVPLGCRR